MRPGGGGTAARSTTWRNAIAERQHRQPTERPAIAADRFKRWTSGLRLHPTVLRLRLECWWLTLKLGVRGIGRGPRATDDVERPLRPHSIAAPAGDWRLERSGNARHSSPPPRRDRRHRRARGRPRPAHPCRPVASAGAGRALRSARLRRPAVLGLHLDALCSLQHHVVEPGRDRARHLARDVPHPAVRSARTSRAPVSRRGRSLRGAIEPFVTARRAAHGVGRLAGRADARRRASQRRRAPRADRCADGDRRRRLDARRGRGMAPRAAHRSPGETHEPRRRAGPRALEIARHLAPGVDVDRSPRRNRSARRWGRGAFLRACRNRPIAARSPRRRR